MAWKGGFSGVGYTREEFKKFLQGQTRPSYPKFFVAHNTAAPYMVPPVKASSRIQNLGNYYKTQGWSSGPNLIVIQDKVYIGTPLQYPGTNSPGWNGTCIGVEVEGDYRKGKHDPKTGEGLLAWTTASWVFAELFDWYGYPIDSAHLKLHKEDPKTTHDCPGNLVDKEWLLGMVKIAAGQLPIPEPKAPTPTPDMPVRWVDTPGDTLNMRTAPGGLAKGAVPHGVKVTVLDDAGAWSQVKTPMGYVGWVFDKYLAASDPMLPAPPAPAPVVRPEPVISPEKEGSNLMEPGRYAFDEFGVNWAKRFEGLMTTAYWDRNDYAIGYGHNNGSGVPPSVKAGDKISEAEAVNVLHRDMDLQLHYLEAYVDVPLTQGQVNALCLHIFQQGPGNFREGKVRPLVNQGKHAEAAAQIEAWPTTNAGLKRRRKVEAQLYRGEKPTKW